MTKIILFSIAIVVLVIYGCATVTPVPTSFQSAKIKPDHFELTPHYSSITYAGGEESGIESHNFGFQFSQGFKVKPFFLPSPIVFCPRLRCELISSHIHPTEHMIFYMSEELKVALIKDIVALSLISVGFHISDEFFHMQIEPVAMYITIPVSQLLEINLSSKFIGMTYNPPDSDSDKLCSFVAINAGLGIGPDIKKSAIRPEISYLYNTNGDNHRIAFGIGATLFTE